MSDVTVNCRKNNGGWTCEVTVDDETVSNHTVDVPESDFESLAGSSGASVEELVSESFEFLLEREPQNAILSEFDIMTIETYFPEYPDRIKSRL